MFSTKHIQTINKVYLLCRSQAHAVDYIRCPTIALFCIPQRSSSSESEKVPRFRPFNSFQTCHGAKNQLISGQDYSVLGSDKEVPFGVRERRRLKLQHKLAADVLRLLKEIEYAKQRGGLVGAERREDERRQHLMDHKLKSKNHLEIDPSSGEFRENSRVMKGKK